MTNLDDEQNIKGQDITKDDRFHFSDFNTIDFEYDQEFAEPSTPPKLCIFCNAEWSPRMETIYLQSGYCESCWESESCHVVVCDKCNRIVYRK